MCHPVIIGYGSTIFGLCISWCKQRLTLASDSRGGKAILLGCVDPIRGSVLLFSAQGGLVSEGRAPGELLHLNLQYCPGLWREHVYARARGLHVA